MYTIAQVPYLNTRLFHSLPPPAGFSLRTAFPKGMGRMAEIGDVDAGPLSVVDFIRLRDRFERIGSFGIAVSQEAHSVLLFCRVAPLGKKFLRIGVTEETSTARELLRLLLEKYWGRSYEFVSLRERQLDAQLLIGDKALAARRPARLAFPVVIDLAAEWSVWQKKPFVFAVWAVRKQLPNRAKSALETWLTRSLAEGFERLGEIVDEESKRTGLTAAEVEAYLKGFRFELGEAEWEGLRMFEQLLSEIASLRSQ